MVPIKKSHKVTKPRRKLPERSKNTLKCSDKPIIPPIERNLKDIPEIKASIKAYNFEKYKIPRNTNTDRFVSRKRMVIDTLDKCCILPLSTLKNKMQAIEMSQGLNVQMCRKSLYRVLHEMCKSKIIQVYEITTKYEDDVRNNRFVIHPKIGIDHPVVIYEINKLKADLFGAIEEKRHKKMLAQNAEEKKNKSSANVKRPMQIDSGEKLSTSPTECKSPKFLISRYLHEFLFYILFELKKPRRLYPLTVSLVEYWNQMESSEQLHDLIKELKYGSINGVDENVIAYTKVISWRTFIPALPKYKDKPKGWMFFMDALDRMPLSVFNKIFSLDKEKDDNVAIYLNHPVRQHYLMINLPTSVRHKVNLIQMQRVYISILKLLNNMGLIQVNLIEDIFFPHLSFFYYLLNDLFLYFRWESVLAVKRL